MLNTKTHYSLHFALFNNSTTKYFFLNFQRCSCKYISSIYHLYFSIINKLFVQINHMHFFWTVAIRWWRIHLSYFESFLSLELCGETGLRTFSPQVPYLQGYNNVNFTLSNVLVTEVCLIQSHIVFMMSVHLNITIQR